jgi:hypothetical protein
MEEDLIEILLIDLGIMVISDAARHPIFGPEGDVSTILWIQLRHYKELTPNS